MKKELVIEWRHVGEDLDTTCDRCHDTGTALKAVISEISTLLEMEGVSVRIIETILENDTVAESNSLLFNGVPIEELLGDRGDHHALRLLLLHHLRCGDGVPGAPL